MKNVLGSFWPGEKLADVMVTAGTETLIAECFCVYTDDYIADSMAYDRNLGFRMHLIAIDLQISGHLDVRLQPASSPGDHQRQGPGLGRVTSARLAAVRSP